MIVIDRAGPHPLDGPHCSVYLEEGIIIITLTAHTTTLSMLCDQLPHAVMQAAIRWQTRSHLVSKAIAGEDSKITNIEKVNMFHNSTEKISRGLVKVVRRARH